MSYQYYAEERQRILTHITEVLETDERVEAAWVSGTIGRSTADDLSDIAVWVAIRDVDISAVVTGIYRLVQDKLRC